MAAFGGDLADVDFRIEVGGEGFAVIAAVIYYMTMMKKDPADDVE